MSKSEIEYLRHIKQECEFILEHSKGLVEEAFYEDQVLKRAFTRCLEIIGEASKRVSLDFRLKYNSIPWKDMAGMRDKIIHHYEGVDYEIVWDTIQNRIPELDCQIELIIKEHK
ncbi:DUF86 domain-containing protein [Flavobacterium sp. ZT3R18]|uniref:HepT-like ribonuclease domain-containing protein n=1 Tax=Flavobacterium sp. ZT3R18 TaxID=2594429 RepID=UPI00117A21D4|nr:DUF86 domain-containing protein [Flavobacterium sp. ZT3R18]TRX33466.1 DUF86 domain-containing protein [Flavobacterium sp. ZT3R18]